MSKTIYQSFLSNTFTNHVNRTLLTATIVMVGYIVMMILACNIYSAKGDEQYEATQYVFNAIIPLIASWVGTVLAFFFGRESFEATTK